MSNEDSGESTDERESFLTRREAMGVGSGLVLSAAGLTGTTGSAAAQETGTEPRIALGEDWEIDDYDDGGDTNVRMRHLPSGSEFVYDVADGEWVLGTLNAGEVDADELNTTTRFSDSGSEVQPAIDAVESSGGGMVFISSDVSQSATWEQPENVELIGVGRQTVTATHSDPMLMARDSAGNVTESERTNAEAPESVMRGGVRNLIFDGDGTALHGILGIGIQYWMFENIRVENCTSHGDYWKGVGFDGGGVYYNHLVNTESWNNGGNGYRLESFGRGVSENRFFGAQAAWNDDRGWHFIDSGQAVDGNRGSIGSENNGENPSSGVNAEVELDGAFGNYLTVYIESGENSLSGVEISGNGKENTITGANKAPSPRLLMENAGFGNRFLNTLRVQNTTLSGGSDIIYPVAVQDIRHGVSAQAESGRPVEIIPHTNTDGNYDYYTLQVKNWDGTDYGSDEIVDVWTISAT